MNSNLEKIRHTAAHVLAQAVLELYPQAKLTIGPPIAEGFYYDFDMAGKTFSEDDLQKLEEKMKNIIDQDQRLNQYKLPSAEAIKFLEKQHQPYKVEMAEQLQASGELELGFYEMVAGKDEVRFVDLCKGPHVKSTKEIGGFKLLKVAGAYWRGDEKNAMLQRIYGTAFASQKEVADYLKRLALAEARDHRKLGVQLELFVFSDLVGPGMPLYTPRGATIRQMIIDYSNELQQKIGYQVVHTPNINKAELFKVSGHYDKFKDNMLEVKSHYTEEQYFLKPMNCPQHTQIYAAKMRSYKDLPIKIADFANLYRDEKPGELSGLTRLRSFSQDDGHCFCREDQIEEEFTAVLGMIEQALKTYGMEYWIRLSLSDPKNQDKYIGEVKTWQKAEKILEDILKKNKLKYQKAEGEAAFYGPKMDVIANDAIGREWQISTIQLDFGMPQRFGLVYIDSDGKEKMPVMIHRAIVGSPERFMAILIEHYAGAFPVWLAPVQAQVIPVGEDFLPVAQKLADELAAAGMRVEVDTVNETVGYKIRKAEKFKVPYMLVIGQKEIDSGQLNVRIRGQKETESMSQADFIARIKKEVDQRL
ncbi:MAG: threonine--tRNA ligase [Candidatus Buchananbacteria bacterium RIFCSPHIGHO2_01_FULL_44_11]|uniref:Threonine--tRNA ligase n=1 Tax=Candidatus Buchananbacteria bacterium RIFCSPHIGHO2_01_FULL_44_11 TaxID=1797535 RepID=A0A1G1Y0T8_9BACT|nr:MAG: threonine--tRNA ligase [Candidatus Buchananbacteria bacterium RIFCSPHIGHO2_01_FULL_44_11]